MAFRLLDSIDISDGQTTRRIALYEGDLTAIPKEHFADILIVSAFADDYIPTRTSVIGALERSGLSVGQLATNKAHDLRATCAFWISNPIRGAAAKMNIGQIACFEPEVMGSPPTVVGDLFRGLFPFLDDRKNQVVAMSLLATGDQGWSSDLMFQSVLDAASHWLARGLAISELKIVERNADTAAELATTLAEFKLKLESSKLKPSQSRTFDVFLSFSSGDAKRQTVQGSNFKKETTQRKFSISDSISTRGRAGRMRLTSQLAQAVR
jgi:hypothetical protein